MTEKRMGRPSVYQLHQMEVGDSIEMHAPTPQDVRRLANNISQYGIRNDKGMRCKTDRHTRIMTITRVR